jgi:hypothetical protein
MAPTPTTPRFTVLWALVYGDHSKQTGQQMSEVSTEEAARQAFEHAMSIVDPAKPTPVEITVRIRN